MTNNLEDFEQPDPGQGGNLPPAPGARAKLAHAWRTRPLFKLMVLMIVVAAVIAVGMSFFSGSPPGENSKIAAPPSGLHEPPGGAASPYFLEQTKKAQEERERIAMSTGGSALPTPIGANAGIDDSLDKDKPKKDPLVELRSQIQHQQQEIAQMKQQAQQPQQTPTAPQPAKPPEQFDNSLAQAMQLQMKTLMTSWEPHGLKAVDGAKDKNTDESGKKTDAAGNDISGTPDASGAMGAPSGKGKKFSKPSVNAGTVVYAKMLTEANSDTPGPILAQLLSGPLKGARIVGEIKPANDYLIMKFTVLNLNNLDYKIDAIALDPDTTLGGMATEVDERYFTRVLLPAAAAFMQGFGQALGTVPTTVVTNGTSTIVSQGSVGITQGLYQGLGQVGQTVGQFFETQANNTHPLIRVAAGTPIGVFFTSTVCAPKGCPPDDLIPLPPKPGYTNGYPGYPNQQGYPYGPNPAGYGYNGGQPGNYSYPAVAQQSQSDGTGVTLAPSAPDNSPNPYNTSAPPTQNRIGGSYGYGSPVINP